MNMRILQEARRGGYSVGIDHNDLPKAEGWYWINRNGGTVDFIRVGQDQAVKQLALGNGDNLLLVEGSAIEAAASLRPVALKVGETPRFPVAACGEPNRSVLVAIVRLESSKPEAAALARK